MTKRRVTAALAITVAVVVGPVPATADDLSTEEFARLAEAASTDAQAREELARVSTVDGRAIDAEPLVSGDAVQVETRLATLSDLDATSAPIDPDAARSEAAAILSGDEYQDPDRAAPGLGRRIIEWLAGLVPDAIGRALASPALWYVLAIVIVAFGLVLGFRALRGRGAPPRTTNPREAAAIRDPRGIEARARRAAVDGDYSTAVRLWFEAGAIRLADRGVVAHESSSTSGAIRRAVASPTMNDLARTFDRVAYGRRPADRSDAEAAEAGWTQVLSEVVARG